MTESQLVISYKGLDSDRSIMDLRSFATSCIGIERTIYKSLSIIESGKYSTNRSKDSFLLKAAAPRSGSFVVQIFLDIAPAIFPVIHSLPLSTIYEICRVLLTGSIAKSSGQEDIARKSTELAFKFAEKVEDNRHELIMNMLNVMDAKMRKDAIDIVHPVGRSCDTILINGDQIIDIPIAEEIRSSGKLIIGNRESIRVKVDGFTRHNNQLKIILPSSPNRYVTGVVQDPAFFRDDNVYFRAAAAKLSLDVLVKIARSTDGTIKKIYILDAKFPTDSNRIF